MRRIALVLGAAALAAAAIAIPAAAAQDTVTVRATLGPAGDPDGSGTAVLELDAADEAVCYDVQTQNVATPITDLDIVSAESGEVAVDLFVVFDEGPNVAECVSASRFQGHARREMRRIAKDPSAYVLEIYNAEHPSSPGAIRGPLEPVS
jgi:hypothetical protein